MPNAATRWQLYRRVREGQTGRQTCWSHDWSQLHASPASCSAGAQLLVTMSCMLRRLTSDVDAAKADVAKAQKDVEAEKKLKLEANTMLKASLSHVCCAMVRW